VSVSISNFPLDPIRQFPTQLPRRRQRRKHQFPIDGHCRERKHSEFDRVIQFINSVQFPPDKLGHQLLRRRLEAFLAVGALVAAGRVEQFDLPRSSKAANIGQSSKGPLSLLHVAIK
jgi:hypothetical protein